MIIALIIIAVIFVVVFTFSASYVKKMKTNPEFQKSMDIIKDYTVDSQFHNAKQISDELIKHNNKILQYREQMGDIPIDAVIECKFLKSFSNKMASEFKNVLVGAITNTKRTEAYTTELMFLSGNTLHLFVTAHSAWDEKLIGPEEQHIIFTTENMKDASLSEKPSTTQRIVNSNKMSGYLNENNTPKILSLTGHDGKYLSFALYPTLQSFINFGTAKEAFQNNTPEKTIKRHKDFVNSEIAAKFFIDQLLKRFPEISLNQID